MEEEDDSARLAEEAEPLGRTETAVVVLDIATDIVPAAVLEVELPPDMGIELDTEVVAEIAVVPSAPVGGIDKGIGLVAVLQTAPANPARNIEEEEEQEETAAAAAVAADMAEKAAVAVVAAAVGIPVEERETAADMFGPAVEQDAVQTVVRSQQVCRDPAQKEEVGRVRITPETLQLLWRLREILCAVAEVEKQKGPEESREED